MMMDKQPADTKRELEFHEDEEAALVSTLTPASSSSVKMPETLEPTLKRGVSLDSCRAQNCNTTFAYRELASATKNFRRECLIGEGGFGSIYKGKIDSTGQVVAIKKLDPSGNQGSKEFLVEVLMLSLLHHPNLVDLVGFCAEGEQRLLVYELLPLGSLEYHLHDLPPDMQPLDWNTRMKIAAGIAEGLDYLHNQADPPVIHRDLKSSNILLGEGFHPKLSDFGLAKFGPPRDKSHVSTRVMGTQGYCAPEYYDTGKLTTKSDIYCFGIVLLEIITGRRAVDTTEELGKQTLLEWARPLLKDRKNLRQLADQKLQDQFSDSVLRRAIDIALMCLQDNPQSRPSMQDLVSAMKYLATQKFGRHAAYATRDGKRKDRKVSREEGKHELITAVQGAEDASPGLNTYTSNKDQERAQAIAEAKQWGESWRAKMQLRRQIESDDL